MKRIVVIGAGATGLAAAYQLVNDLGDRKDAEILLLEKSDRVGGQILSVVEDDFVLECGPDCFISDKPAVLKLAEPLGITDELTGTRSAAGGTDILTNGKLVRMPEGVMMMIPTKFKPFISTKLLSWPGKIRAAMDVFIPRRKNLDDDETLASFVNRRLGKEILDRLAEPLVGGIHASDPDTMSLAATFPRFLKMEKDDRSLIMAMLKSKRRMAKMKKAAPPPEAVEEFEGTPEEHKEPPKRWTMFVSFKQGMQTFTDALAAAIGPEVIKLNTEVTRIEQKTLPGGGVSYKLNLKRVGDIEADAVIIASLAPQAGALVESLDATLAGTLRDINCVSSATVNLVYRAADLTRPLETNGCLIPQVENREIMATTWTTNKWPYRAPEGFVMIRAFVGGAFRQELVSLSDEEIMRLVRDELKSIVDISAEPVKTRITRWVKTMPQYSMGHLERIAIIRAREQDHPGLFLAGASYSGVGVPDCVTAGQNAAQRALEYIRG